MRKRFFLAGAVISLVLVSMLSGCATVGEPDKAPEEVIKDGMSGLADLTSYKYDLMLKADVKDTDDVKFDVKLSGAVDVKDPEDPKFTMKLDGSASDGTGAGGSAAAELRMNKEAVYAMVSNLKVDGEELPAEVTEMFGKWWMMEVPAELMEEVSGSLSAAGTSDQEDMKKALEDAKVFATPKFVGADNIMGEQSYHYNVTIDKKALVAFAKEAAEAQGETISAAEVAEMEEDLEKVDVVADVWVGSTSNVITQFSAKVNMKGGEGEPTGTLEIKVAIGDINKPVTIDVPSGAEEFPIESLLGPMMMMGGGMGADPMMYDDSMMYDDAMMDADFDEAMFDEAMMEDFDEAEFDAAMAELEELEKSL